MTAHKNYFASFGYYDELERVTNQAMRFEVFDKIVVYGDNYLKHERDFWEKHGRFIQKNPNYHGCAFWKPYIILKTFEIMNYNDILLYCDACCQLNADGKQTLLECIDILSLNDKCLSCFQTRSQEIFSNIQLLKKTEKTISFLREWTKLECEHCSHVLKNDNDGNDDDGFIEHYDDKSIFSSLCKKKGAIVLDGETYCSPWVNDGI